MEKQNGYKTNIHSWLKTVHDIMLLKQYYFIYIYDTLYS